MAARIHKITLDGKWREKIRIGMLLNHLRNHVLGRCEMSPTQVRAAEILLKKVAPDLQAIEHTGEVAHSYVAETPARSTDTETWQQQHSPTQH